MKICTMILLLSGNDIVNFFSKITFHFTPNCFLKLNLSKEKLSYPNFWVFMAEESVMWWYTFNAMDI